MTAKPVYSNGGGWNSLSTLGYDVGDRAPQTNSSLRQCLIRPKSCERGTFFTCIVTTLSICLRLSLVIIWPSHADTFPSCWLSTQPLALRAQAGCWWQGGGWRWGSAAWLLHRGRQPITREEKELANRFSNGTPHAVIQDHKPLSSPIFHFSCLTLPRLHVSRRVMPPCTQWARTHTHTQTHTHTHTHTCAQTHTHDF